MSDKIDKQISIRLRRAIVSLFKAGRNLDEVVSALSPQASFGKYDGCFPDAIRSIARWELTELNEQVRRENEEIRAKARAALPEQFRHLANNLLK